jgi:hypothetical protein
MTHVAATTPELTPPAVGSLIIQLKLNGALYVPDAGESPIVGAVLSIVIVLEVPVPVESASPEFWSEPLAEPEKLSVPSPLTGPQV